MTSLQDLSDKLYRELQVQNNDIPPVYMPNMREIRQLSKLALDILIRDFSVWSMVGPLKSLSKTREVFRRAIFEVKKDLDTNQRWSYWHYAILTVVTCLSYAELIKKNKHKTIDLSKQSTWLTPGWEVAHLSINYTAGRLYPNSLARLIDMSNKPEVSIEDLCAVLLENMKKLHQ